MEAFFQTICTNQVLVLINVGKTNHSQANVQDSSCANTTEELKKMPQDAALQSLPTEPDGSDCEVLVEVDGAVPSDNLLVDGAVPSDNSGFKIPDVPKPSTGADEVADWAAEVGVSIFLGGC